MKKTIILSLLIFVLFVNAKVALKQLPSSPDREITGMGKVWLEDGRIIYGHVFGKLTYGGEGVLSIMDIVLFGEPGFIQFADESQFNRRDNQPVEIGLTQKDRYLFILTIIVENWGSFNILIPAQEIPDIEWSKTNKNVFLEGTDTGFSLRITP